MQVVDVDNVRQRVTVKLIPRVDLQTLANKLVGSLSFFFLLLFNIRRIKLALFFLLYKADFLLYIYIYILH